MIIRKMGVPIALAGLVAASVHETMHSGELADETASMLREVTAIVERHLEFIPTHGGESESRPAQTVRSIETIVTTSTSERPDVIGENGSMLFRLS